MRLRTTAIAAIGTAALVVTTVGTGAAGASGAHASHVATDADGVTSSHGAGATAKPMGVSPAGACQTSFGNELASPNGFISWNDKTGSGHNTAGAADVVCLHPRGISVVMAYGYSGARPTDRFHVTFYGNDSADGSDEPDDNTVLCDYPAITGAAGGKYPTHVKTVLRLHPFCRLPAGQSWVSIQNVDRRHAWYWEMQNEQSGAAPDWVDHFDAYGSGCTTYDNDRYATDCTGLAFGDWMLSLRGPHRQS